MLGRHSVNQSQNQTVEFNWASSPPKRIASEDYFRALKSHQISYQNSFTQFELPERIKYAIDKTVRKRLAKGWYGYDNSQFLACEFELREPFLKKSSNLKREEDYQEEQKEFPLKLLQKLSIAADKSPDKKLCYEDWKRMKLAEERLIRKLTQEAYQIEYEKKLMMEADQKAYRERLKDKSVRQWIKQKNKERFLQKRQQRLFKKQEKTQKELRKKQAESQFKNWLQDSLKQLKQQKQFERVQKENQQHQQKCKELQQKEKKLKAKREFKKWLKSKKKEQNKQKHEKTQDPQPRKPKTIILAYSPNKPHTTRFQRLSQKATPKKVTTINIDTSEPQNYLRWARKPKKQQMVDQKDTFEELSSIRRSPFDKASSSEEEEESFISMEDNSDD